MKENEDLKIYLYTVDQPGIGGVGIIHQKIENEIKLGWRLLFNLHNHNFFTKKIDVNGVVTNGIDSAEYFRRDIEKVLEI